MNLEDITNFYYKDEEITQIDLGSETIWSSNNEIDKTFEFTLSATTSCYNTAYINSGSEFAYTLSNESGISSTKFVGKKSLNTVNFGPILSGISKLWLNKDLNTIWCHYNASYMTSVIEYANLSCGNDSNFTFPVNLRKYKSGYNDNYICTSKFKQCKYLTSYHDLCIDLNTISCVLSTGFDVSYVKDFPLSVMPNLQLLDIQKLYYGKKLPEYVDFTYYFPKMHSAAGYQMFRSTTGVLSVNFGNMLNNVAMDYFAYSTVTDISVGKNMNSIGWGFMSCPNLSNIYLPSGLTAFSSGMDVCWQCYKLKYIKIPKTVKFMYEPFRSCSLSCIDMTEYTALSDMQPKSGKFILNYYSGNYTLGSTTNLSIFVGSQELADDLNTNTYSWFAGHSNYKGHFYYDENYTH